MDTEVRWNRRTKPVIEGRGNIEGRSPPEAHVAAARESAGEGEQGVANGESAEQDMGEYAQCAP